MRIKIGYAYDGVPDAYVMWLSAQDTYDWAHRAGASWPCSTLSDRRLVVCANDNGLYDLLVDGRRGEDVDANELEAVVTDHLPQKLRHLWPVWGNP